VFTSTVQATRDLTGGETGMVLLASADPLRTRVGAYYSFLAVVVGFLALHRLIQRSPLGVAFRAIRDDDVAAELAGIDVARHKVLAGLIGSAMLGAVGALWAHHEGFISPQTYAFAHIDVRVLVMLAFGGIGTLLGPIVGAATFELDRDGSTVLELACALNQVDTILFEKELGAFKVLVDDLARTFDCLGIVSLDIACGYPEFFGIFYECEHGRALQQRLRRDAAAMQACAAKLVFLDDSDLHSELCRANRGDVTSRATPE
jgi:hypothetical protein